MDVWAVHFLYHIGSMGADVRPAVESMGADVGSNVGADVGADIGSVGADVAPEGGSVGADGGSNLGADVGADIPKLLDFTTGVQDCRVVSPTKSITQLGQAMACQLLCQRHRNLSRPGHRPVAPF